MFKVLQINASYKPAYVYGGPTISVSKLCEALAKTENNITVLTTTANGKVDFDINDGELRNVDGVSVYYFYRKTKDHSHWSPSLLKYLYTNISKYDIVHIQAWWNLVSMGAAFVCKIKRKDFVLSPRGTLSSYTFGSKGNPFKRIFHNTIGKWVLKNANFQVSTEKEAEDIKSIFKNPRIKIIPNLIQLPSSNFNIKERIKFSVSSAPLKLVFFSRVEKKKGLEFILNSLNNIKFDFVFDIFGTGDEDYKEKLKSIINPAIKDKINFKGAVFGDSKFQILSYYDLMVLPSHDENFANVVIESLSVGTAVLITHKVGLSDYVIKEDLGWICDQSVNDITRNLDLIFNDYQKLSKIREIAPMKIQNEFSEEALIIKYLEFYNTIRY